MESSGFPPLSVEGTAGGEGARLLDECLRFLINRSFYCHDQWKIVWLIIMSWRKKLVLLRWNIIQYSIYIFVLVSLTIKRINENGTW